MGLIRSGIGALIGCSLFLTAATGLAEALKRVETKYVCMVNDQLFPKEQIPTTVEGKTYYGCCEMCASKLSSESAMRHAKDPVSGKEVDKATAVIGATKEGAVHYFENNENLETFSKR